MPALRQHKASVENPLYGVVWPAVDVTIGWIVWRKPRRCSFIYRICLGGGGGGAGGWSDLTLTARPSGGGGGSGGISRLLVPARLMPDVLYLLPGGGGAGGVAGAPPTAGVNGGRSAICLEPNSLGVSGLTVLVSGAVAASGGGAPASNAAGGAAGTGESAISNPCFLSAYMAHGLQSSLSAASAVCSTAGVNGAAGSTAAGTATTWATGGAPITGGGSGGGGDAANTSRAGGALTGASYVPTIAGSLTGVDGVAGYHLEDAWTSTPGTAGGNGRTGAAGNGGHSSWGCGGPSGGGGNPGGAGGNGGPGMIILVTW